MRRILHYCIFTFALMAIMNFVLSPQAWYPDDMIKKAPNALTQKIHNISASIAHAPIFQTDNPKYLNWLANTKEGFYKIHEKSVVFREEAYVFLFGEKEKHKTLEELIRAKIERGATHEETLFMIEELNMPENVKKQLREIADV